MENFPYIFLELIISATERHLYIGKNLQAIMDDTEDGTCFLRTVPIQRINPLTLDQVKDLRMPLFCDAIEAMQKGDACYYVGEIKSLQPVTS
jgi:hypothetical protein